MRYRSRGWCRQQAWWVNVVEEAVTEIKREISLVDVLEKDKSREEDEEEEIYSLWLIKSRKLDLLLAISN